MLPAHEPDTCCKLQVIINQLIYTLISALKIVADTSIDLLLYGVFTSSSYLVFSISACVYVLPGV